VVGFDDVPQAAWGAYQLTTVVQSVEDMVNATVNLLNSQMQAGIRPGNVVIPCSLVERHSVRLASAIWASSPTGASQTPSQISSAPRLPSGAKSSRTPVSKPSKQIL
jgi:hypothetical protein